MRVYRTAGITAVWRHMAKVDTYAIKQVDLPIRLLGYLLGRLDPHSVKTIGERTIQIDSIIKKIQPKCMVEIGAGFSSRARRYKESKVYELDLPALKEKKPEIIPFEIGKQKLPIKKKNALYIIEGVTMYLQKEQVKSLLKQIKQQKGHLLIDFFNKEQSSKEKNIREKCYKAILKKITGRKQLFDFRIKNKEEGISLLKELGYKKIKHHPFNIPKTIDTLFEAQL